MLTTAVHGKTEKSSHCPRCGGFMVRDRFYDWMSDSGRLDFEGMRCLVCGEIEDPLIIVHRQHRPEPQDHHRYFR